MVQSPEHEINTEGTKGDHRTRYTGAWWPIYVLRYCSSYEREQEWIYPSSVARRYVFESLKLKSNDMPPATRLRSELCFLFVSLRSPSFPFSWSFEILMIMMSTRLLLFKTRIVKGTSMFPALSTGPLNNTTIRRSTNQDFTLGFFLRMQLFFRYPPQLPNRISMLPKHGWIVQDGLAGFLANVVKSDTTILHTNR